MTASCLLPASSCTTAEPAAPSGTIIRDLVSLSSAIPCCLEPPKRQKRRRKDAAGREGRKAKGRRRRAEGEGRKAKGEMRSPTRASGADRRVGFRLSPSALPYRRRLFGVFSVFSAVSVVSHDTASVSRAPAGQHPSRGSP